MNRPACILFAILVCFSFKPLLAGEPKLIEQMMEDSEATFSVLKRSHEIGDDFSVPREVDFYFIAESLEKAEIVMGFINDFNYGKAMIEKRDDKQFGIKVITVTPINQNIITPISSFMVVVANTFGAEYVGWGSPAQINE